MQLNAIKISMHDLYEKIGKALQILKKKQTAILQMKNRIQPNFS